MRKTGRKWLSSSRMGFKTNLFSSLADRNRLMSEIKHTTGKKNEIIQQAALELFKLHGFEKVSVNDIARKARISRATVYNYYNGKEDLIRETIRTLLLSLMEKYRTIIKGDGDFIEKLELIVFDRIEMLSQYQGELAQTMIMIDPEIKQFVLSEWQQEFNQLTLDLFEQGKREGHVRHELSDGAILFFYETLRRGMLASSTITNTVPDVNLTSELMSLFLHGLGGETK